MMGKQSGYQHKLFVTGFNLEKRIRTDHPLRKIAATIDFDFIYHEVKDTYGDNGNVSVQSLFVIALFIIYLILVLRVLSIEENQLSEAFAEEYRSYSQKVRRLVPFIY